MKRFLEIIALPIIVVCGILFVACKGEPAKEYRIGFSQCSGDYWRQKTNQDLRLELLNHPGVELDIRNADNDSQRQKEDIEYFIENDYDLIIVAPNEADPLVEVVDRAMAKGIPVVTFDRRIGSDNFTAHLEVDNYALGKGVAQYASTLGNGTLRIIEIEGPAGASPARLRHKGFMDGIEGNPKMNVLASVKGDWLKEKAHTLMDSLLRLYPEVNLVYAHTDHMALGASEVLKERGREDVYIIGIDGFPYPGIKAVSEGDMTATFLYPTEGQRLLNIALAILNGEPYDHITQVAPLSPIDSSNADILLAQETLLNEETAKIDLLNGKIEQQLVRYSSQKTLLWAFVAIAILLCGLIFLLLRSIRSNRRHQKELEKKNLQLEEEKGKQERLYTQLRAATSSKLMFFTNVSHDLRTPLTLIAGPVEQVAEDPCLTPRCRALMRLTKKNVVILRRLVDQILDFRKYENGKTDLRLSEVVFPRLLKEWAEAFEEVAKKRDITLQIDIKDREETTVAVDVEKMERVFFNLMSNAFKHTPDNGKITVSYNQTESLISYSVIDTGCGIDNEEVERIFDRFYQVEGANPKGSGIGLALTKAFIELHGGSIDVSSEKGKGSIFTVSLPVRHTDNERQISAHITEEAIEAELSMEENRQDVFSEDKPTLLVIDDNRDIRTLISTELGEEYNILTAVDGIQGVRMATKYVPDLILCDVVMPGMNGLECVKELKEELSTSHIPILMLTACAMDEQKVAGYEHGADAYIPKPFNLDVLTARCRNLIANRKRIKELYGKVPGSAKPETLAKGKPIPGISHPNDVESEFYSRFVEIVQEHLSDPDLQISDIASQMGLSQSQFTRKIKSLTNYTPVELIRNLRLQKAKTMLMSSEKTVSEIAYSVGFTSLPYFSRCYKEKFGISPSEAR